jgi:hypothetical protein
MGQERKKATRIPEPVGSRLTSREKQAALRYIKTIGDDTQGDETQRAAVHEAAIKRAIEVLTRIFVNNEEPVKPAPKEWQIAWKEIRDNRDRLRKSKGDLYHIWNKMPAADNALPSYKETQANADAALQRFRGIMQHCLTAVAAEHHEAEAGLLTDMAKIMSEAAKTVVGMVDTGTGAAVEQPAAVNVVSAD